jgi:hypothetical protein
VRAEGRGDERMMRGVWQKRLKVGIEEKKDEGRMGR